MIYVVGSGPAGVSCARALLGKGAKVTLLDVGLELELERSDQLVRLRSLSPEKWRSEDLAFLKEGTSAGFDGIPLKYAYGSDFPYRDAGIDWVLENDNVQTRPSFAKGGLSTVWGAAVLPYRAADIRDWPIGERELARHYRAVLEFMPLAGCRDLLEQLFPLYSECPQTLKMSRQAQDFLQDLSAAAAELKQEGIVYGASRLAVWAGSDAHAACCYCAQCMYGCPFGVIYSSSHTLDLLRGHPNFTYWKNVAVDRVEEHGERVTLLAHDVGTRDRLRFQGSRVFFACGVLATTKILLESLEAFDHTLILQDSFYFLLPLFRLRATPGVWHEELHTLAQLFLEILDPRVCKNTIHLQVYTHNELFSAALKQVLGPLFRLLGVPVRMLQERLLLIQGYLPSSCSPAIRAVLRRDSKSGRTTLRLSPVVSECTLPIVKEVFRKLKRARSLLRAIPVGPMLRPSKPGRGFHSGGSFPMHACPTPFKSDQYGRPFGFQRVHAVDATVFPSVPSTTITLSVMANAHRIGSGIEDY
jgi:choline dehydrogenase-like flavoprotein